MQFFLYNSIVNFYLHTNFYETVMYMYTCLILLPVADSGGGGDQVFKTNVFNTHDYKFGLHCSSLLYIAENSVCKSNTSSGGRCWGLEVVKRFRG